MNELTATEIIYGFERCLRQIDEINIGKVTVMRK